MQKLYINIIFILILIAASGYCGCSSSSYTSRYHKNDNTEESEKSVQRFSDNDTLAQMPDSLGDDLDEMPEDSGIDIISVLNKLKMNENETDVDADNSTVKEKILMEIIKYLNTPYKYGGDSPDGIDCSAFTRAIYSNVLSVELNRSAKEQYTQGTKIDKPEDLKFGDLVFFNTRRRVKPGHVGIYIGDNLFAHASSKNGVIVSSLEEDYYSHRFMGGRRIEPSDIF